jgi:hypothetical protein
MQPFSYNNFPMTGSPSSTFTDEDDMELGVEDGRDEVTATEAELTRVGDEAPVFELAANELSALLVAPDCWQG